MSQEVGIVPSVDIERRALALVECLDYALAGAIAYNGGVLTGFSLRIQEDSYLLTLRAHFPAGHMICWTGGNNIADIFLKAVRLSKKGEMTWYPDKYRQ